MKSKSCKQAFLIAAATTVLALLTAAIVLFALYKARLDDVQLRLSSLARSQVHHIRALDRLLHGWDAEDSTQASRCHSDLEAIIDTLFLNTEIGDPAELMIFSVSGDSVNYLFSKCSNHESGTHRKEETELSEPLLRALRGESGIYKGVLFGERSVFAAYEPVIDSSSGLIVFQELSTIQSPFIHVGTIFGILLLFGMAVSFFIARLLYLGLLRQTQNRSTQLALERETRNAVEAELTRSEQRFRLAAQTLTDLIYEWDITTDELLWFGDIDGALGYQPGTFPRTLQAWLDIIHPEDAKPISEELNICKEKGLPFNSEYRLLSRNGDWRLWKDEGSTILGDDGKPIRLIGACTDITEKRRAETKLKQQARLFEMVSDAIITIDLKLNIDGWNRSAERIFGYTEEEALDRNIHELLRTKFENESRDDLLRSIEVKGYWQGQVTQYTKAGKPLSIHATISNLYDENGRVIGRVGSHRNITKRVEAEKALQYEKRKAQEYLDVAGTIIVALDTDGLITMINRKGCDILGWEYHELIGRDWFGLCIPQDFREHVRDVFTQIISGKLALMEDHENEVATRNGEFRLVMWHNALLRDDMGRIIGTLSSGEDITERKRAEAKLHESAFQLREAQRVSNLGSFLLDVKTGTWSSSDILKRIFGIDKNYVADVEGWLNIVHPEQREELADYLNEEVLSKGNSFDREYRIIRQTDQAVRWVHGKGELVFDRDRIPIQMVGTIQDITERKQAELVLRTSTVHLQNALRVAKLGPWQYDVLKDEFTFSDEFYAIFKTSAEANDGYTMSSEQYAKQFVYPEDMPLVGQEIQQVLETHDPDFTRQLEHRIIYADGTVGYIAVRFQVELNDEGRVTRTYGMNQDITERYLAEQKLRENEARLRQLFENSGEGILIVDLEERIIMANSAAHRIFGVEDGSIVGEDIRNYIDPEQRQSVVEQTQRRLKGESSTYELSILRTDGERRHVITTVSPWRNHEGTVVGSCGVLRDITAREHAAAETRAARKMLQDVIDAIPAHIFWKDCNSVYMGCNQTFAQAAGLKSTEDIIGKNDYDMPWTKKEANSYRECDARVMNSNKPEEHVIETQHNAEGKDAWLDTSIIPLHDDEGRVIGILGLYQDITETVKSKAERRKLEDQLRQSQKLETIGTLAGGIAHDFNNILVPILVTSQMILEDIEKDSQTYEDVEQINIAAKRARDLVRHILTFSRQSEGERINIDLTQIVKEVVKLLQSSLPSTILLNYNITPECGRVVADPTQIHQVLMNLCTNAYQAIGENEGRIAVRLERLCFNANHIVNTPDYKSGEYVVLSVEDTGSGIKPETLEHIFDPFFTTKEVGKGTGLGLSVAHGIAKHHGGFILVDSEVGKGSKFSLYLPVAETASENKEQCEEASEGGNERVLLVDDDPEIANMARRILERFGYSVTVRTSSIECIEAFKARPDDYDIILTDQIMPQMTGDQLIEKIHEVKPDLPAVLMTGFSTKVNENNYKTFGFDEFVMKPMVPNQLNSAIRLALAKRAVNEA